MGAMRGLVVVAVLACPAAAAQAWVVDADGGGDFTTVDAAVAAAASGDVILVRPGSTFAYFVAPLPADKSLALVADTDGVEPVRLTDVTVDGMLAGVTLVVRGFSVGFTPGGAPLNGAAPLCVRDSAGSVFVEDCVLGGLDGTDLCDDATPGVTVSDGASVTMTRCTITGGTGIDGTTALFCGGSPGEAAAVVNGATVAFYDCTIKGGTGGNEDQQLGGPRPAGDGLQIGDGAVVTLAGTSVAGGDAAFPGPFVQSEAGDGLDIDAPATVRSFASTFAAGEGLDAVAVDDPDGVLESVDGEARSLAVPSPLRDGEAALATFDGVPDDAVALFLSVHGGMLPLALPKGALALGVPIIGPFALGAIPSPAGALEVPFVAPPPAVGEALPFLMQATFTSDAGTTTLGSPTSLAIVEAGL